MLNRREALGVSLAAVTAATHVGEAATATATTATPTASDQPRPAQGFGFTPIAESNPLEAKITVFTTVSPDVDASIRFYRDVIGMTLAEDGTLPADISSAPGVGKAGRRHAVLTGPGSRRRRARSRTARAPARARATRA